MKHYDEETLAAYADNPAAVADPAAIERHLRECDACQAEVAFLRSFDEALADDATWEAVELGEQLPSPSLNALAEQTGSEDREAELLLRDIIHHPIRFLWEDVASKLKYRTGGVVRRLCREVPIVCERQPEFALDLATAASAIAAKLPDKHYPANMIAGLRGLALKECGNAYWYLGDLQRALAAFEAATTQYRTLPVHDYAVARVDFSRATVLRELERLDEALLVVRGAGVIFERFGDSQRVQFARLLEGNILHDLGRFDDASGTLEAVHAAALAAHDDALRARAAQNLAVIEIKQQALEHARRHVIEALDLYASLEMETERTRARWTIALLLVAEGQLDRGIEQFRDVINA